MHTRFDHLYQRSAMAVNLQLLSGKARGVLAGIVPKLITVECSRFRESTRVTGLQMVPHEYLTSRKCMPLDIFKRSYLGMRHQIWSKIPQELIEVGKNKGWNKIIKRCKRKLVQVT